MTRHVVSVSPELGVHAAAATMGREQIRRLPVVENGKLCGLISLGDIARVPESTPDAVDALTEISSNISRR
jgi:CBS domain-containing protein